MHQEPLKPHKYPVCVILFVIAIIACTVYAMMLLPKYMEASKNLVLGMKAYREKDYQKSISLIEATLQSVPSSKEAKIAIAKTYFGTKNDAQKGLFYLNGITLNKSEWEEIKAVMPIEYQKYFRPKYGKKL